MNRLIIQEIPVLHLLLKLQAIFILMSYSAILVISTFSLIPIKQINNKIAIKSKPFSNFFKNKNFFVLTITISLLHLGNASNIID